MSVDSALQSIGELRQSIATLTEQHRSMLHMIDEQRERTENIQALALSVREQTTELRHLMTQHASIVQDVEELKQRSGKRWEGMLSSLISTAVGALAGAAMLMLLG